jgi:peptidoglycan/xylan/chitin deacetylase (PgdA/CDA1 family)
MKNMPIVKTLFVLVTILMMGYFAAGIFLLKDNYFFSARFARLQIQSFLEEVNHANGNGSNLLAGAWGFLKGDTETIQASNGEAKAVPVLLYHSIIPQNNGVDVSEENFKDQMYALKKAGYQTIHIQDFYDFMLGKKHLPPKSILITFDDGRSDGFYPVDPVLRALDYSAVMFTLPDRVFNQNDRYHLNADEIKYMAESGRWDIQAHGYKAHDIQTIDAEGNTGHFLSDKLWLSEENRLETDAEFKERITNDLVTTKQELEKLVDTPIFAFAYPFGDYGIYSKNFPESTDIVLDATAEHYSLAFTQIWWGSTFTHNYPEALGIHPKNLSTVVRLTVEPEWTGEDVVRILDQIAPKDLPYHDTFERDDGWLDNWGHTEVESGYLKVFAENSTGAVTFLDGTLLWKDYYARGKIVWKSGDSVAIGARFQDTENFVMCHLVAPNILRIEERLLGERRILRELKTEIPKVEDEFEFGIQVKGNTVDCLINGTSLLNATIDESLSIGGISWKAWDEFNDRAELMVDEIWIDRI